MTAILVAEREQLALIAPAEPAAPPRLDLGRLGSLFPVPHDSRERSKDIRQRPFGSAPPTSNGGQLPSLTAAKSFYSMTSSARSSKVIGTVRFSILAVFRLMINSTLVACWTGRLAGFFAPQNAADIESSHASCFSEVSTVAH